MIQNKGSIPPPWNFTDSHYEKTRGLELEAERWGMFLKWRWFRSEQTRVHTAALSDFLVSSGPGPCIDKNPGQLKHNLVYVVSINFQFSDSTAV